MTRVDVPSELAAIGFSGDFWLDATTDTPLLWRRLAPCLLGNSGWMVLRVNDDNSVTVVRKDAAAIWDLITKAPGSMTPPALVSPVTADDWVTSPPRYRVAHRLRRGHDGQPTGITLCGQLVRGRIIRDPGILPRCLACQRRLRVQGELITP